MPYVAPLYAQNVPDSRLVRHSEVGSLLPAGDFCLVGYC
jgi:hypothetical protein